MFFSLFSIAIISLGEERTNLSAFRTFVRFELVWFCWFPLPLGVWEGLRFVGGGPGVGLTLCCFVVYSTRRFVLCLTLCYLFLCFSVLLATLVIVFTNKFCIGRAEVGDIVFHKHHL